MTRDKKLLLLQRWATVMAEGDELITPVIEALDLNPKGPITTALWSTQGMLTEAVSELVGDTGEWLTWFCADNEMGARGLKAGLAGAEHRAIQTVDDLLWLIEVSP